MRFTIKMYILPSNSNSDSTGFLYTFLSVDDDDLIDVARVLKPVS